MQSHNSWVVGVIVAGILGVASAANAADDPRDHPTLAIVDFDAMPSGWILPPPQLGTIVAELLLDKLVGVAPFRLLDGPIQITIAGGSHRSRATTRVARAWIIWSSDPSRAFRTSSGTGPREAADSGCRSSAPIDARQTRWWCRSG